MFQNRVVFLCINIISILSAILLTACSSNTITPSAGKTQVALDVKIPTPTATDILIPSEIFSLDDANMVAPQDVLEEVSFSLAGGGWDRWICRDQPQSPSVNMQGGQSASFDVELLNPVNLIVCGWQEGEQIDVSVQLPGGKSITDKVIAASDMTLGFFTHTEYIYYPALDATAGLYVFTFKGDNGSVVFSVNYQEPVRAGYDARQQNDSESLILYGFLPREHIRLLLYTHGRMMAWQEYHANESGRLAIKIPLNFDRLNSVFVILGDKSGELHYYAGDIFGSIPNVHEVCEGLVVTQLGVGSLAYVSMETATSNRLRSGPGKDFEIIDRLLPGTLLQVIDGPTCADGIIYWQVQGVNKEFKGWTGEGDHESYWLVECGSPDSGECPKG